MKWLDSPTQQASQKCPMCNLPLSIEIIRQSLIEEQPKTSNFTIFGLLSRNSQTVPIANDSGENEQVFDQPDEQRQ